ncbi:helix-turn-helix domain-containing protein [Roseovarius sp.]|uniref:helix-turn-helix domain-containing protein n=1 Tax=Roseovarius sp. TaxID=1486281 RepID=UPI003BAC2686
MSFHPRMYAAVQGFQPLGELKSLSLDRMVVDYWRVRGRAGAGGRYASLHPRFVLILDDRRLSLSRARGGAAEPAAGCYIPAGLEIWGTLPEAGELRHVDIHLPLARLRELTEPCTPLDRPVILPELGPLAPLAGLLRDECTAAKPSGPRGEALARAAVTEMFHLGRAGQLGHGETWLDTLRAHVLDRMAHRIAIDDLARAAGLSRTHFNRTFRRATGQSPYRWVLGLKLGYAKRLLVHGVPCAEVAQVTGFADQAHFSRSFRAETGAAPAHWAREQAAGPNGPIVQDNPSR